MNNEEAKEIYPDLIDMENCQDEVDAILDEYERTRSK